MIYYLVACTVVRNERPIDAAADARALQNSNKSIEPEIATNFEQPSKPQTELSFEDQTGDVTEGPSEARLAASIEKNKVIAEATSETKQNSIVPTAESVADFDGIQPNTPIGADPTVKLCWEVGNKLGSVTVEDCLNQNLIHSAYTIANRSLAFKDYLPEQGGDSLGRVLVIGGIHGDEFSSVSVIIKWMKILDENHSGLFHWRFVPTANPDGLLKVKSQRQNSNGVDLNRNFPTTDWQEKATSYWEQKTHRNPRRNPGPQQASELETQWLVKQIKEFEPDVIVSLHAPYHLIDYDGPPTAPEVLGGLSLRRLGVYPGSLGNYAGIDLKVPIVTVELKSAGIMPVKREVDRMWRDLVQWLQRQLSSRP